MKLLCLLLVVLLFGVTGGAINAPAQSPESDAADDRISRLETLADLWGKLWLFHPNIVTTDVDWDEALYESIAAVERARNNDELVQALNTTLLTRLGDDTVLAQLSRDVEIPPIQPLSFKRLAGSIGYLDASDPRDQMKPDFLQRFAESLQKLGQTELLVVDLRYPDDAGVDTQGSVLWLLPGEWLRYFLDATVRTGSYTRRTHWGWRQDNETPFQTYYQEWRTGGGEGDRTLEPINRGGGKLDWFYSGVDYSSLQPIQQQTVLLVNNGSLVILESFLDALQSQPHIAIVWERVGRFWDSSRFPGSAILRYDDGIEVQFRTANLMSHDGALRHSPDLVVDNHIQETDIPTLAREALRVSANKPPRPRFNPEMRFPSRYERFSRAISRDERLLSLFKVWTVIRYFNPHHDLADIDWENALGTWIPRAEADQGAETFYERTISELISPLNDSHIGRATYGGGDAPYYLPIALDRVRDIVYVSATDGNLGADIQKGDIVRSIDGVMVEQIESDWRRRISLSTEPNLARIWRSGQATRGKEGESGNFTVERDGVRHDVALQRTRKSALDVPARVARREIGPEIGYIDLTAAACQLNWLEETLEQFQSMRGFVLDLRGYPRCSGVREWLVNRFADQPVKSVTEFPVVVGYDEEARWFARQTRAWVPTTGSFVDKPVVVLINDRAMSSPENMALLLEQMPNVKLVGSHTVGTTGDTTGVNLPGGVWVQFTGRRVLRGDGSRFQNIGVVPDVEVYPTVEGMRAGRDEVLEKGVEVLRLMISDSAAAPR